jgi:superfamily II DNA or RNA helicase
MRWIPVYRCRSVNNWTPRPYQSPRIAEASDRMLSGLHAAMVMATGTGKTSTALAVVDQVLGRVPGGSGSALWLTDRKPLVRQTTRVAAKHGVPVEVRTIQGLRNLRPEDHDILVIDEAHKFLTPKRIDKITQARTPMLLLTATPRRGDGKHIDELGAGPPVGGPYTLGQAITDEWLCDCMVKRAELRSLDLRQVKRSRNDFDQAELASVMNDPDVNREVVERTLEHARLGDGSLMLTNIFGVDTAHADAITAELERQAGAGSAMAIHSNLADADERIEAFLRADRRMVASVMMVAEGFDYPALRLGVLARPTKSERLLVQMLGRFLRLHDSKPFAILLDCDGAYESLDISRIYDAVESSTVDEPTVSSASEGDDEDDPIPMLSSIVSQLRDVDLFRRQCQDARTLPWHFVDGKYVMRVGQREMLVVGRSKYDRTKAAAARFWRDCGYARCDVITPASPEPVAFRMAEAWAMGNRLLTSWADSPMPETRKLLRDWLRDVEPPSDAMGITLADHGYAVPSQHGVAVKTLRRLYARGDIKRMDEPGAAAHTSGASLGG